MKKEYFNPQINVYMLQASNNLLSTSNVEVSTSDFNSSTGTIKGRQGFFEQSDED